MDLSVLGNCEEFSDFSGQNTQDEMRSDDEITVAHQVFIQHINKFEDC